MGAEGRVAGDQDLPGTGADPAVQTCAYRMAPQGPRPCRIIDYRKRNLGQGRGWPLCAAASHSLALSLTAITVAACVTLALAAQLSQSVSSFLQHLLSGHTKQVPCCATLEGTVDLLHCFLKVSNAACVLDLLRV